MANQLDNLPNGAKEKAGQKAGISAEMRVRLISATIMISVALAAAVYGGIAWALLAGLVMATVAFEWTRLADASRNYVSTAVPVAFLCGVGFVIGEAWVKAVALLAVTLALALAARRGGVVAILGSIYLAISCFALGTLRVTPVHGDFLLLMLFAVVWATDSAAYFVGRAFGGKKLWPEISPKKTWSGFLGGVAAGLLAATIVALINHKNPFAWALMGAFVSVAAQAGDLLESFAKRYFQVKDTAGFIPGHGGVLDRIDGHLSAALALGLMMAITPLQAVML